MNPAHQAPRPPHPAQSSQNQGPGTTALAILAAIVVGGVLAAPALIIVGLLWPVIRGRKERALVMLLFVLAGWGVLYLQHEALIAGGKQLFAALQGLRTQRSGWADLPPLVFQLWQRTWPLAPTVALLIESLRPRSFAEQHRALLAAEAQRERARDWAAQKLAAKAPEATNGAAVLGAAVTGQSEAPAFRSGPWAVFPPELLNRHAVVIGSSGTGKTECVLRLAYLARVVSWGYHPQGRRTTEAHHREENSNGKPEPCGADWPAGQRARDEDYERRQAVGARQPRHRPPRWCY